MRVFPPLDGLCNANSLEPYGAERVIINISPKGPPRRPGQDRGNPMLCQFCRRPIKQEFGYWLHWDSGDVRCGGECITDATPEPQGVNCLLVFIFTFTILMLGIVAYFAYSPHFARHR
jgi:hypothetical protein